VAGCTFKPETKKSMESFVANGAAIPHAGYLERNEKWAASKEERMSKRKEAIDQLEVKECTFTPDISTTVATVVLKKEKSTGKVSATSAVETFLQRQAEGRVISDSKKSVPHVDGSGWKYNSTRPLSPTLLTKKINLDIIPNLPDPSTIAAAASTRPGTARELYFKAVADALTNSL
jgi:hypothetical protein